MSDYENLSVEQLRAELSKVESLLEDVRYERAFQGKQTGMHMSTSVFVRLDLEIEKYENAIADLNARIAAG